MARPLPTSFLTCSIVDSMKRCAVQVGLAPQIWKTKFLQNLRALRRVVHLGMELHRIPFLLDVLNSGDRVVRLRHQFEARRQFERFVAVRHPDGKFLRQSLKQHRIRNHVDFGVAVFALFRRTHLAAERVHHELQSVADAKNGHAQLEDARVGGRRVFVVDRPWRARENDAGGRVGLDLGEFRRARQHDGKNILLADAARDQLRVLCAEIKNDDGLRNDGLLGRLLLRGFGFHG